LGNYSHVHSYVIKAESTPDLDSLTQSKLKVAAALAHLDNSKYKVAARTFLEVNFELGNNYNEVINGWLPLP
jgi:COP9 signalosome complex subunit 1